MRIIAWFNLATTALCALACVTSESKVIQFVNAILVFMNILCAGFNSQIPKEAK